ncbi:uncharacterized protein FMAN_09920 [Fusarium mangiferae]|uniref:Uncharacterized protein n=1 Tax=Fusarium mangiferae TaxID=192010 RepID=A0A1L7U085_FUSMA|nr:uncharacterized protein FMAN_09920 [Fusarium mangiferae]CVL00496.1 uncharacterized protein FMAN_09920 [Fusarium mangiferae]
MSLQQGPASTNVGQQSLSNNQKASNVIGESILQLEAVLSQLRDAKAAAEKAEKECDDYKATVNNLQEELKVLKEEGDAKDKRIKDLKEGLYYYERQVWPESRWTWLKSNKRP